MPAQGGPGQTPPSDRLAQDALTSTNADGSAPSRLSVRADHARILSPLPQMILPLSLMEDNVSSAGLVESKGWARICAVPVDAIAPARFPQGVSVALIRHVRRRFHIVRRSKMALELRP
jgi:hypothetical protein